MKQITSTVSIFTLGALLGTLGCSSSNNPATTSPAGGSANGGQASIQTGGSSPVATGGNSTSSTGTETTSGTGGTTSASTASVGGSTSTANTQYQPLCDSTVTKGGPCGTQQLCYKTCGPQSIGFKSETCSNSVYVEQSGCSFPPGDYSCYKIPTAIDASCPTTAPQASQACSVAPCTPCNVGGMYLDSSGNSKAGYCVCPASTTGTSKWSCASTTAWPCPGNSGC